MLSQIHTPVEIYYLKLRLEIYFATSKRDLALVVSRIKGSQM